MADGSSGNQGQLPLWQCKYCPKKFLGVPPDSFEFCPKCGKEQKQDPPIPEVVCVNPECKATLFSEKAKICHICKQPQQQETAATPTDSSKAIEEHKLKIAQAVESKKQQSQEHESTTKEMEASHGAGKTAGNPSAAEPQKGEAQTPPHASTSKEGESPENPIVVDSTNAATPVKDENTTAEATVTGPNLKDVSKSDTESITEHAKDDRMPANGNVNGHKTNKPPEGTSSHTPEDPAIAKRKVTPDQPSKQNPNSGAPSPDPNKSVPDPRTTGSGVPEKDLARMSIEDVRSQNRKRSLEGPEGERPPGDAGGSSTPSTYAAAAKVPAPTTQPSQTQTSVPPVKKQRNNGSEPHGSNSGQENTTTHPSSNSNQSTDPQVYV